MSRHAVDHRAASEGGRLKHYLKVERQNAPEGSHEAVKAVNRRETHDAKDNRRPAEFLRIDRGQRS